MSIAVQVVCDGCGISVSCGSGKDRKHAHQVRSQLRDDGWSIGWTPNGDLCKDCRPPRQRSKNIQPRLTGSSARSS